MPEFDSLLEKELAKFKAANNQGIITLITSVLADLHHAEIFKFLRLKGRVKLNFSENPVENAALNGAHSAGYQQCIDDLENFLEFFVLQTTEFRQTRPPVIMFGALKKALEKGDITQKEYDELTKPASNG